MDFLQITPRKHFYIALLLLSVVFTPFGMNVLSEKQHDSAYKLANYREALAHITTAKEIRRKRSSTTVNITYDFRADSDSLFSGSGTITLDEWRQNRGEKPVRVYFNPSDPTQNVLANSVDEFADERPLSLKLSVGALLGSPFALVGAGIWAWMIRRRSRQVKSLV